MNYASRNCDIYASLFAHRSPLPRPIRTLEHFTHMGKVKIDIKRQVCLTFDDGPDPDYTPEILAVLADYGVKATFFVVGEAAERFPQLVEKIVAAGHTIGNHTYSHRHPWLISSARAKSEVARTTDIVENIIGSAPRWFRPPFGRLRTAMRKQAHAEHMATVLWSHSIIDWGALGTKTGIARRLDQVKAGDIVLMHDGKPEQNRPGLTLQCLPGFLRSLAGKSLVACNLDEVV